MKHKKGERICKIIQPDGLLNATLNTGNFLVCAFVRSTESVHSFSQESVSCCKEAGLILYQRTPCIFLLLIRIINQLSANNITK